MHGRWTMFNEVAMSIILNLSPDIENVLRNSASRDGTSVEGFVEALVESWAREHAAPPQTKDSYKKDYDEWVAQWRAWVASHKPVANLADDSRENIYAGRGE